MTSLNAIRSVISYHELMSDRVALVIGNSAYPKSAGLRNPTNDAKDLAKKLRLFGFTTTTVVDGTKEEMETALEAFKRRLDKAKVGLLFFAGHGFQGKSENYLVAVDSKTAGEIEARNSFLSSNLVIETMEDTPTDTNIITRIVARRETSITGASLRLVTRLQIVRQVSDRQVRKATATAKP